MNPPASSPPPSRQGMIFDLCIFVFNIAFVAFLDPILRGNSVFSKLFGVAMLLAVVLYAVGAYLKKAPLTLRLRGQSAKLPSWFQFLGFLQFIVFGFLILIGLPGSGLVSNHFFGGPGVDPSPIWWIAIKMIGLGMIVPAIIMGITFSGINADGPSTYPSWRLKRSTEVLANILLTFSVMVITALWGQTFAGAFTGAGHGNILLTILWLVCSALPFAMFYLAPRALFLAEDYRNGQTWVSIFLVVLPIAWRILS